MKKFIIALVIVATISILAIRNNIKRASEELDYGIAPGFKVTSFTFGQSKMVLPFWINNPTGLNLTISNIKMEVFINNVFAGNIKVEKVYKLNSRSRSVVPLTIEIDNISAMNILMNISQYLNSDDWRTKVNISVRGTARLESGFVYLSSLPIKADGTYKYWMG